MKTFEDDLLDDPVVLIKSGKLSLAGGRLSVHSWFDTIVVINPNTDEAHHLKLWWENEGKNGVDPLLNESRSFSGPDEKPY